MPSCIAVTAWSSSNLSSIFDQYWRGGREAAGLGLYVVKGIVEAHGGCVQVDSEPQRGSTFTFTLPLTD